MKRIIAFMLLPLLSFGDVPCVGSRCNLNGGSLETCSMEPLTGYTRNGACEYLEVIRPSLGLCRGDSRVFKIYKIDGK